MCKFIAVTVLRNGIEEDIKCQEILQGDLVKSMRDCDVPCDIVLLKSSDPNGKCHITTANLDGETNLKTLMVPKGLPNVPVGMRSIVSAKFYFFVLYYASLSIIELLQKTIFNLYRKITYFGCNRV